MTLSTNQHDVEGESWSFGCSDTHISLKLTLISEKKPSLVINKIRYLIGNLKYSYNNKLILRLHPEIKHNVLC